MMSVRQPNHPQVEFNTLSDVLHLRENKGEDIKQFYHLGKELGEGTYGLVKISTRNCHALNQHYIQKNVLMNQESQNELDIAERQLSYAIKQQLIPEFKNT